MEKPHYTEEQIAFIRSIAPGRTRKEITDLFNREYQCKRTVRAIGSLMSRQGIQNKMQGHTTRFHKGQQPWNKGLPYTPPGGEATQFKPGHTDSRMPVGATVVKEGTVWIKVENPDVWVRKHRHIWEQAHGPIPHRHVILFKDGNRQNVELDNLMMVSREVMTSVARRGRRSEFPEVNEAVHTLAALELKIKNMEKEREG